MTKHRWGLTGDRWGLTLYHKCTRCGASADWFHVVGIRTCWGFRTLKAFFWLFSVDERASRAGTL